jgi:hypothetical protein
MKKELIKKIGVIENKIEGIVENIVDGISAIDDNLICITKMLKEIKIERDYIDNNIDDLMREQRNLALMESALNSLDMIEEVIEDTDTCAVCEDVDLDEPDEEEEEDEEDYLDECDECHKAIDFDELIELNGGQTYLCKECFKKQIIKEYEDQKAEIAALNSVIEETVETETENKEETDLKVKETSIIDELPPKKELFKFFNKRISNEETTEE